MAECRLKRSLGIVMLYERVRYGSLYCSLHDQVIAYRRYKIGIALIFLGPSAA